MIVKILLAMAFLMSAGFSFQVSAQNMTGEMYEQHFKSFNADFITAMQRCIALKNQLKMQCRSTAHANRDMQKADLKASYKPTIENRYNAHMIKAELTFKLASEKCENIDSKRTSACMNIAKQSFTRDMANAKTQRFVEMNQAILKSKDLIVERFNSSSSPFVSTELKKPFSYKT